MTDVEATTAAQAAQRVRDLTEAVRAVPRPEALRDLVHARNEAFHERVRQPRPEPWPADYADPFPDVLDELCWVTPHELEEAVVGGALRHHGCLGVRGLLSVERAGTFAAGIAEVFASRDDQAAAGRAPSVDEAWQRFEPAKGANSLVKLREWVHQAGAVFAADAPRLLFEVIEDVGAAGLFDVVEEYLGERPALSVNKTSLRCVPPTAIPAWHQDGSFLGDDVRAVNLWVALTACGGDRPVPGLDIVPRRLPGIVETGTDGAMFSKRVGQGAVERIGAPILRPEFDPGDALLFDEIFLHRTATEPTMTSDRYALEWWMFAPSGFPPGYVPLAI